jgi:phospholipase C
VGDQSSILRFIEDNFNLGRIDQAAPKSVPQGGSFDQIAGSLESLFDFGGDKMKDDNSAKRRLILDPDTGEVVRQ